MPGLTIRSHDCTTVGHAAGSHFWSIVDVTLDTCLCKQLISFLVFTLSPKILPLAACFSLLVDKCMLAVT